VGHRDPGLALGIAVVLGGELIDARAEDLGDQPGVGGEKRPQREPGVGGSGHGFIFHTVVPSFLSSSSTPIAFSSSRLRSASLKFLALRAAFRASTFASISTGSKPASRAETSSNALSAASRALLSAVT